LALTSRTRNAEAGAGGERSNMIPSITLFAGPSSSGKTTHVEMLARGLQDSGFAHGIMESTYRLSARILVDGECPEETETTLSITIHRLPYEVQGLSFQFLSVEYDGQSHMGAALALHYLIQAINSLDDSGALNAAKSLETIAGALLGVKAVDPKDFIIAFRHLLSLRLPDGTLGSAYLEGLARAMGLTSEDEKIRLKRVINDFISTLYNMQGNVNASMVSKVVNYVAALHTSTIEVIVPPPLLPKSPCSQQVMLSQRIELSRLLREHIELGGDNQFLIIVESGEASRFYAEFLMIRLAVTGLLIGFLLAGFHLINGNKVFNIMHPADMIEYSLIYAARQAQIDAITGNLLGQNNITILNKIIGYLEEAAEALENGDIKKLKVVAGKINSEVSGKSINVQPTGRGLLAYPYNVARVLGQGGGQVGVSLMGLLSSHVNIESPSIEGLELASRLGGPLGKVAQKAVELVRKTEGKPKNVARIGREIALAVAGLIQTPSLLMNAWQATFYTHVLLLNYLFRFVKRASDRKLLDPNTLKLSATLSYLDKYDDPKAAFERLRCCVFADEPEACRGLRTYPVTVGLEHDVRVAIVTGHVYGNGVYVIPGGYRGDLTNSGFTLAMLCNVLLPQIYNDKLVMRLPLCRKVLEATRARPRRCA